MNGSNSIPGQRGLGILFAIAALLVVLVVPIQASAQVVGNVDCGPTVDQYNPPSNPIDCDPVESGSGSGGGGGGTLPFTGIEIVPLALIAAGLAGTGFLIRRYGKENAQL